MKYLKMFDEKYSIDYIKNVIDKYDEIYKYLKPIGLLKYYEIANSDLDEEPEYGDIPDEKIHKDELSLYDISNNKDYFELTFIYEDKFGTFSYYYIKLTNQDILDYEMKVDAKNFNL